MIHDLDRPKTQFVEKTMLKNQETSYKEKKMSAKYKKLIEGAYKRIVFWEKSAY